jgi:hypothetical protein
MEIIDLQNKTKTLIAEIQTYWFENKSIGLRNTLFHKITIPLDDFDSGLTYVEQPEKTEIVFDWYDLKLDDPLNLNGLDLSSLNYPEAEASVYIGSVHNCCIIKKLFFELIKNNEYKVVGELVIEFENEGVGQNEIFNFNATAIFNDD